MKKREIVFIFLMLLPLGALGYKYFMTRSLQAKIEAQVNYIEETVDYRVGSCPENQVRVDLEGGVHSPRSYICRDQAAPSLWVNIYDNYPKSVRGQESIYRFMDKGSLEVANDYLDDWYSVPRFDPVEIENITWEEDPYDERYWRFIFYSLRETNHLIYAGQTTGEDAYNQKLVEIIESFVDEGMDKEYSWDDYHGVSFRTLSLVNAWWKLREQNALPVDVSTKMLQAFIVHGDFLMEEEHFESHHNHGITEATALLVLGSNFPDLPGAEAWKAKGIERLNLLITNLVDDDGVLVENTPYYHLYSLEKLWEIYHYAEANDIQLGDNFNTKIQQMIDYTQYILQPNLHVPLLGASLEIGINLNGEYKEMADIDPELLYVLTKGAEGDEPDLLNIHYPTAGQTIMRSGWGQGEEFTNQTQLVYEIGPYRTAHSDLDGLSFTLYSNGVNLITDSGIYTYEQGPYRSYFHGTAAHNTVLVNDSDQFAGSPSADEFVEGKGYAFQSAHHNLYPEVTHYRSMALLGHDYVLIVDRLVSQDSQNYKQLFHLFPEAELAVDGLTVTGEGSTPEQTITIHQLMPEGIELSTIINQQDPPNGLCSFEYEKGVPCYAVVYEQNTDVATYVTILEIGQHSDEPMEAEISEDLSLVHVQTHEGEYFVTLEMPIQDVGGLQMAVIEETSQAAELTYDNGDWELDGASGYRASDEDGVLGVVGPTNTDFDVRIEGVGTFSSSSRTAATDIPTDADGNFIIYEQEDYLPIFSYRYLIQDYQTSDNPYAMRISDFIGQVEYASEILNCNWYTFADIMENYLIPQIKTPRNACVMTFDGGHMSNYALALPILEQYDVKASFFITPGRTGTADAFLTWGHVHELYLDGHEIGAYAYETGSLLDESLTYEDRLFLITQAKKEIEERGIEVKTFAYPYGDWNEEIVQMVKDAGFIAARDSDKPNSWRDRRTMLLEQDALWHMYSYRPEANTPVELGALMGYNTWWQFEEGFTVTSDEDTDIDTSSNQPTLSSFGVVELDDTGDSITNEFLVSENGNYTITVYASTGFREMNEPFRLLNRMRVSIDGIPYSLTAGDENSCATAREWIFCDVQLSTQLQAGKHTITVESTDGRMKFDKFNMYRTVPVLDSYPVTITARRPVQNQENRAADNIYMEIDANLKGKPFTFPRRYAEMIAALGGVAVVLSLLKYRRDVIRQ